MGDPAQAVLFGMHYDVAQDDLMAAQLFMTASAPTFKRQAALSRWAGAIAAAAVMFVTIVGDTSFLTALALSLAVGILLWLVMPWIIRLGIRLQVRSFARREGLGSVGPHTLWISEAGLREESLMGSMEIPWTSVTVVQRTPDHLFVLRSPLMCLVVPIRGVETGVERLCQFAAAKRSGLAR